MFALPGTRAGTSERESMAKLAEEWKTLTQTETYWLRSRKSQPSEVVLECAIRVGEHEDAHGFTEGEYMVYEFEIPQLKLVKDPKNPSLGYLVPLGYDASWPHPLKDYEAWFATQEKLDAVADSANTHPDELVKKLTSKNPKSRAGAYR